MGDSRQLRVSPDLFEILDLESGQQVRIQRAPGAVAVYTVEAVAPETASRTVRMGPAGSARLSAPDEFEARIDPRVPHRSASVSVAKESGHYVEQLRDDGGRRFVVIAPHGGRIEALTDREAERVVERVGGGTAWIGRGWRPGGGAFERWHVTSTAIHPAAYPKLGRIADREFERAVSFHGFDGRGILVGGAAPARRKRQVVAALDEALGEAVPVRLASGRPYSGDDPGNLVNWLTADGRGGIQIEQGSSVRSEDWRTVADTVASVLL